MTKCLLILYGLSCLIGQNPTKMRPIHDQRLSFNNMYEFFVSGPFSRCILRLDRTAFQEDKGTVSDTERGDGRYHPTTDVHRRVHHPGSDVHGLPPYRSQGLLESSGTAEAEGMVESYSLLLVSMKYNNKNEKEHPSQCIQLSLFRVVQTYLDISLDHACSLKISNINV